MPFAMHSFTQLNRKRARSSSRLTSCTSHLIFRSVESTVCATISSMPSFSDVSAALPASRCTLVRIWSSAFLACMLADIIRFFASSGSLSISSLAASVCIITVVIECPALSCMSLAMRLRSSYTAVRESCLYASSSAALLASASASAAESRLLVR